MIAWGFEPELVFRDLELFRKRLITITEILQSAKDYGRLDKMEIGGIKGRMMGQRLETYFKEYHVEYEKWLAVKFNPLDLETDKTRFESQFAEYQQFCDTFERKLATIFIKAFCECRNFEEAMKLIEMSGALLKRPKIYEEIQPQMEGIIEFYRKDLEFVDKEFESGLKGYRRLGLKGISYNKSAFPPVSGTLMWIKSLKGHISDPVKDLDILDFP